MLKQWIDDDKFVHSGEVLINKDGYDVIECEVCGFIYLIPFLEKKVQNKFYSEKFYQNEVDNYIERHKIDRKIHNKRMLMEKNFLNANFNNIKRDIYDQLSDIGIGREITIIGQKK